METFLLLLKARIDALEILNDVILEKEGVEDEENIKALQAYTYVYEQLKADLKQLKGGIYE